MRPTQWRAAWCFFGEGDAAAEAWVAGHARRVLAGKPGITAAAIRRKATHAGLSADQRRNADTAAAYLLNKRAYLRYDHALAHGWPIATGIIEGACRHLVKDRMDITGARWGLHGAEAILKLRALLSNGDFDAYWAFHLQQEQQRVHLTRYRQDFTLTVTPREPHPSQIPDLPLPRPHRHRAAPDQHEHYRPRRHRLPAHHTHPEADPREQDSPAPPSQASQPPPRSGNAQHLASSTGSPAGCLDHPALNTRPGMASP